MKKTLNITNGDCAIEIMKKANIAGTFLPWRDVLHDGPVPDNLSLDELSKVRSKLIIERNWGAAENIRNSFIERDKELRSFEKYEKVILWFEHDLYDQLQILQILDWFHQNRPKTTRLSIICVDKYLGLLSPDEMLTLYKYETPVTEAHFQLSNKAWSAFRSDTPEKWTALLTIDTSLLPFLEGAIYRLLEEFPNCTNGLSRTANQALKIISQGEHRPERVFGALQHIEERQFMGDSSFWVILHQLLESSPPLLTLPEGKELTLPASSEQALTITPKGEEVLSGKSNWLDLVQVDHWIGGVHLTSDNIWCWNSATEEIAKHV